MLPVKNGIHFRSGPAGLALMFWLNREMQTVQIRLAEAALRDLQQFGGL
jgi:hypothetical protein